MIAEAAIPVAGRRVGAVVGGIAVFVALTAVASRNGGYFPTSFGWSALVFAWCALLLVLIGEAGVTCAGVAFVSALSAFAAWIWLSTIFSRSLPATVLEGERALVYVAATAALVFGASRVGSAAIAAGVLASITAVSAYALTTRVFPDRVGAFDAVSAYRLSTPVGYWNGLGLFAAIGALLALAFVARARAVPARALAAVALVVLLPTIYFTFSRGAWLALGIALLFLLALDPRRLHTVVAIAVVGPAAVAGVVLASHSAALTTLGARLNVASHQGHRLAVTLVALAVLNAALVAALALIETRLDPGSSVRRGFAVVLGAVLIAGAAVGVAHWGSPWHIARTGWHSFTSTAPAPTLGHSLNGRLFHLSGSGRIVSWRSSIREFEQAPVVGTGAGTFETWWVAHRPAPPQQLRDAHSLYLETLGELGVVGLILLLVALAVPLGVAVRRRHDPLIPFAAAGLLAWAVHAGVDWDWEIPAVTLPALACGVVCVHDWGRSRETLGTAGRALAATIAVVVAGFAFVAAIGNQALSASQDALAGQNYARADEQARRAASWAPWSAEPWLIRGELQALNQDPAGARKNFERAIGHDPRNYLAWYGLAGVDRGAARRRDAQRVVLLNPLSDEAAEMRTLLK